jgi:hypothetical protein
MRFLILFFCLLAISGTSFGQDDLLKDVLQQQDSSVALLPKKMLLTQRIFWGEHGIVRPISPLTSFNREKELKLRRGMLIAHQVLGFATLGGMIGQGIVGSKLYNATGQNYRNLKDIHEGLAATINITYSTTAIMSLFAPPPLINRDKKISSIRIHKWLALLHMSGMIATNLLAESGNKQLHRAAAYTTFASFGAAVIAIKF